VDSLTIFENINQFTQELEKKYPTSKIIILSIINKYSDNRKINQINNTLKKMTEKCHSNLFYLDINKEFDDSLFFQKDNIHLNKSGYDKLNSSLTDFLDEIQ